MEPPVPVNLAPAPIEEKGGGGSGGGSSSSSLPAPSPPSAAGGPPVSSAAAPPDPPATPSPPGPTSKRDSLRLLVRLSSRRSLTKEGASPWAVGLSSARVRAEKERRQWETGVTKFNQKPTAGVDYLVNVGLLARTPEAIAGFLRQHTGELSKRRIGEYVGSPDPFAQAVLAALLRDYDFEGLALDEAMRLLINDIRFPGESQVIDRILQRFAARYFACNCRPPQQQQQQQQRPQPQQQQQREQQQQQQRPQPQQQQGEQASGGSSSSSNSIQRAPFATEDAVYILSFSLMLLNTDLHNRSLKPGDKMSLEAFVRNNRGINNGQDLPRELLAGLYQSVKRKEMRMREGDMYDSSFLPFVAPRLSGWLAKESTGLVARWKSHWFVLSGGVLYYFQGPHDPNPRCMILLESVTAIKGPAPTGTDILLYSHQGGVIKSVKIRRSNRTMVQGARTRYLLRAASREERDEWLVALQQETPAMPRQQRLGSGATTTTTAAAQSTRTSSGLAATATGTIRSPRSAGGLSGLAFGLGLGQHDGAAAGANAGAGGRRPGAPVYRCLAEGWMRRRSDVSRTWQRRYFMLLARDPPASSSSSSSSSSSAKKAAGPRIELLYFTTQEMGQRMLELGLMTAQGGVPMQEGTMVVVKPAEAVSYRLPEPGATLWEIEFGCRKQRVREVVSPERAGEGGPEAWLEALREQCPMVAVRMF